MMEITPIHLYLIRLAQPVWEREGNGGIPAVENSKTYLILLQAYLMPFGLEYVYFV
jgi:hypothetical protein